jgi:hypothetical protein
MRKDSRYEKTEPFAELAFRIKADPVRRVRIATYRRAMEDAMAQPEFRAQQDMGRVLSQNRKTLIMSVRKSASFQTCCASI